ncbi:PEP-CTERM sorting domain-containing protein [Haloferula sargassicola]|uniref:PEP-CTERM sorting domain-containing protein n=1 Tax=Haloferula sargassicola TaxID=490096 RepID=UPI003365A0C3
MKKLPFLPSLAASAAFAVSVSQAAVIFTPQEGPARTSFDGEISPNLITAGQPSLASMSASHPGQFPGTFPTTGLNDGSAAANGNLSYWATMNNGDPANWMPVTITFELTGSATGYDLTEIQSIAGWNDSYLGDQSFQLLLSIGGGGYSDFGTYTNTSTLNGGTNATLISLTDTTGAIASGVTGIQFVFMNPGSTQGGDGGTVIHELQAFGTPTVVPEPGVLGLGGWAAGLLGLARRRRG